MKKREIYEILDSDGNIIGGDDMPPNDPNTIKADGTTDRNAAIGHQHFGSDFLGRFGFYMYNEGEGDDNAAPLSDLVTNIAREAYTYFDGDNDNPTPFESLSTEIAEKYNNFGKKIVGILQSSPQKTAEPTLTESELSKMIEDVIAKRTDKSMGLKKQDNDILDVKIKNKLKKLLGSLSDKDKGELIKHLK